MTTGLSWHLLSDARTWRIAQLEILVQVDYEDLVQPKGVDSGNAVLQISLAPKRSRENNKYFEPATIASGRVKCNQSELYREVDKRSVCKAGNGV